MSPRSRVLTMLTVLAVSILAGCLDDNSEVMDAKTGASKAQSYVDARYEAAELLLIGSLEGKFEFDLSAAGAEGNDDEMPFSGSFRFGKLGDGMVGSWFAAHMLQEEETGDVGVGITQVFADGRSPRHVFEELYSEEDAMEEEIHESRASALTGMADLLPIEAPHLQDALRTTALSPRMMTVASEAVGCPMPVEEHEPSHSAGTGTRVADAGHDSRSEWNVGSKQAATIAMDQPAYATHVESNDDGDFIYLLVHLAAISIIDEDVQPADSCNEVHWAWIIINTDIDQWIELASESEEMPEKLPSLVAVILDGSNGEVIEVFDFSDGVPTYKVLVAETYEFTDSVIPTLPGQRRTQSMSFTVTNNTMFLEANAQVDQRPLLSSNPRFELVDPSGDAVQDEGDWYYVEYPQAGEWTMNYSYQTLQPLGQHSVRLYVGAVAP